MPATEKQCAYVECNKSFYGGRRAMYCCPKHAQYQRRLNKKEASPRRELKGEEYE